MKQIKYIIAFLIVGIIISLCLPNTIRIIISGGGPFGYGLVALPFLIIINLFIIPAILVFIKRSKSNTGLQILNMIGLMIGLFYVYIIISANYVDSTVDFENVKRNSDLIESSPDTIKTSLFTLYKQNNDSLSIEDSFVDSTNIASNGLYKIDVKQVRDDSIGVFVFFDLFKKDHIKWALKQSYKMLKDDMTRLNIDISDFNNDGCNDLTIQTEMAARGSNEIKTLFIFDKLKEELVLIKNSSEYPNLKYNKRLDCIDAWLIYGGSSTIFLKLEADSLREFAGVSLLHGVVTIYEIDSIGNRNVLEERREERLDEYTRFMSYKPLTTY